MTVLEGVLATVAISAAGFWAGRRGAVRRLRQMEQDIETSRGELKRRMDEVFSLQELSYLLADASSVDRIADQVAQYVMRFIDSDGVVGFGDFLLFAAAFGGTDATFDLDGDGPVGFSDFLIFADLFGQTV